jgi:hypothetical protein
MAEDLNRTQPEPREDGDPPDAPLPEPRAPFDKPEAPRRPETLPDVRPEEVTGTLEEYRGAIPPSTYAPRFRALTGALTGVAIGALIAAGGALFGNLDQRPEWSRWQPSESGLAGASQIARHIGPSYRLPGGAQLVKVSGGEVKHEVLDQPAKVAVSQEDAEEGALLVGGKTVQYELCGTGPGCAIQGEPSKQRFLLVRREGLELALYSFRYLKGVDNVVALLPPTFPDAKTPPALTDKPQKTALFFQRKEFADELELPLAATLPSPPPTTSTIDRSPESGRVNQLTATRVFRYTFRQAPDLTPVLLLNPAPTG